MDSFFNTYMKTINTHLFVFCLLSKINGPSLTVCNIYEIRSGVLSFYKGYKIK